MKTLLNIASGSTNLLPPVFNFSKEGGSPAELYIVHNVDIAFTAEAAKGGALAVKADASKALPYVSGSVDVVLAVSPYKLAPVNQEVVRVLKPGGGIVAVANSSNPYINAKATESPMVLLSVEELKLEADAELSRIAAFIKGNYISLTAKDPRPTALNAIRIWRKK